VESSVEGGGHVFGREFGVLCLFSDCVPEHEIGDFDGVRAPPGSAHERRHATAEKSLLYIVVGCSGKAEVRTCRGHIAAINLAATKQLVLDLNNVSGVEEIGLLCESLVLNTFG